MITRIIEWSLDNRFLIIVATLILIALGVYAIQHTPVDAIPDLSDVQVIVKTNYPGQAPQVVEDQVTYPLATAMLAVPGAVTVRAYSFFGDSYVYVIFKDGTDLYWARSRVLEYLNQVASQLPSNAKPELGPDATGVGWIYQYALVDKTGHHDLSELTSIQNWQIKYELQTVPGVSEVATMGGMVKQYQVVLDPDLLRTYGLTLQQVKKAIQEANSETGGSVVEMGEAEYMVRTNGYIHSLKDLRSIPLGINHNGTPILLKNVATIRLGPEMRRGIAELNGKGEVVGGVVVMRSGENALKTITAVKKKLHAIQKSLPKGVRIVETYDRSGLITRGIHNLQWKLVEESLIVMLVCFVFLCHFRSALIVIVSLPIGILAAFLIMYWQGINANIMSLGGIAIAIGAMTDAAIVMIENVHKHIERDGLTQSNRWQLIRQATLEVGPPLFFSLLIITLSFLPVFALQAQEGKLFAPLAFTKTYAMAASAGLSITLVPVLMGLFIRGKIISERKNPANRFLIAIYRPVIHVVLKSPWVVVLLTLLVVIATSIPIHHLGSEFMPTLDEGDWMYMPTTLPGISIGKARQLLQQTDKLIKTVPEVKSVFGKIGRANTATDPAPLTMIESVIQLKPKSEWRAGMTREKLKAEFNQLIQFPGLTNAWVMPIKTRIDMLATGIKTPVGIKITGPSLHTIQSIGQKIEDILKPVKGTASVYADRSAGGRYIQIKINRQHAARYGLNIKQVQEVVRTAIGGMNVTQTIEGRERFPVNIRYPQADRDSLERIKALPIVTPTGAHIPLDEVADVFITGGPPVIKSEDAKLTGWVLVDIDHVDVGTYIKRAKAALSQKLTMPPGYRLIWSGQYEYMQRAKARLMKVVPITLIIIILLLYLNFKSVGEVLIILLTLPLALAGGFWTLFLLNFNWSIAVGVGMIALAGVAVEIGVIMLVYLNQSLNDSNISNLETLREAVIKGALLRVRPIIMTVATIVIGLLPIMLGTGTGSEVMQRIAAPMFGGMISATVLTLILLPAIFYLWKSKTLKLSE
ncbi:MAG: efflux RND transporter permease subunit [Legionellales bacterium]|nr:efflux RND transporter permease subunit [Legionellales bacterium]